MVEYLRKDQISDLKKLFDDIDVDKDGKITLAEMYAMCKERDTEFSEEEKKDFAEMAKQKNSDASDIINFPEFLSCLAQNNEDVEEVIAEIINAFRVFDHDQSGKISMVELKHILTNMGMKYTDEEVEEMFKAANIDKEDLLKYEDFVRNAMHRNSHE